MENLKLRTEDLPVKERLLLAYLLRHIKNERVCPSNQELSDAGYVSGLVPQLARKGFIEIQLNKDNLRVITCCSGTLKNRSTKKPVADWKATRIIGYDPTHNNTFGTPSLAAPPPWEN